jgi:spermidine synthase
VLRRQDRIVAFEQERVVLGQQRLYIDGSHHGDAMNHQRDDGGVSMALAVHAAPRRVLSIGLGDGQMAATAAQQPDVNELVIVELNGTLERIMASTARGQALLTSEKVRYIVDDGRRWLLAHPHETFDVILMYPLHAAQAYTGNLFSREFLTMLAGHLNPGGILFLRSVDLYSTARTIAAAYPFVVRFDRSDYLASRDRFLVREERLPVSVAEAVDRLKADRDVILAKTEGARINSDFRPNSEYYLTYPYASHLQARSAPPPAYSADPTELFRGLVTRAAHHGR